MLGEEAAIPIGWSKEQISSNLNLTHNDTCAVPKSSSYGVAYTEFVMPANSGVYSAIFEIKNPGNNSGPRVGVALASKIKAMDQGNFQIWGSCV